MPRFTEFYNLGLSQHEIDFVDVSNEYDIPVYVDPYAIEVRNDIWSEKASENIRVFFKEVLDSLIKGDDIRAASLMSNLHEPSETFLGVSSGKPRGKGVGANQATKLIAAIKESEAYKTGILSDLSEMALYVDGIDRDKISDLTTNVIRDLLVEYTQAQCELYGIPIAEYSGPPLWDNKRLNWVSRVVKLPRLDDKPTLLVPKYIVRRALSLNSQEFYNKQITDFLVAEALRASSALVRTVKGKRKVLKTDVREAQPKSKKMIADLVKAHPELLDLYKKIAKEQSALTNFNDDDPTVSAICGRLAQVFGRIPPGAKDADRYHNLVIGVLTALFHPDLIQPHKEWNIHDGRKRIDLVFTNSADAGFFAQRRNDPQMNANTVIVECKNYSTDLANQEVDQLLGRFDNNRGYFGFITCRDVDDQAKLLDRCRDAAVRGIGYVIVLTDADLVQMLEAKSRLDDDVVQAVLYRKYRKLLT